MIHEVDPELMMVELEPELELESVPVTTTSQQGLSGVDQKEFDCLWGLVLDNWGTL